MKPLIRKIVLHYGLAIILAVLVSMLSMLFISLFSALYYSIIICFIALIWFYDLTTYANAGWTKLSFIVNFIVWFLEMIIFTSIAENNLMFDGYLWFARPILFGVLWASNKLMLDKVFRMNNINLSTINKIEQYLLGRFQ